MSKVDWITWNTNPEEILNPDKVLTEIELLFRDYNMYMNAVVYESINHEMKFGGLDENSLTIQGINPAHNKANEIVTKINNIKEEMEQLKSIIRRDLVYQKIIEKQQLIDCLEDKMEEEEKKLENTLLVKEKINPKNSYISLEEVEDIIELTRERIRRIKEKLERAKEI